MIENFDFWIYKNVAVMDLKEPLYVRRGIKYSCN